MIKIAVCDDDRTVRESIVKALQRYERDNSMEFEILEYAAADAMLVSYPAELDLILLDIYMPGIDGMDAAKAIRRFDQDVCIIFITTMYQRAIEGYKVRAFGFIRKPVSYGEFSHEIGDAVRNIERSRQTTLARVLYAIGIPGGEIREYRCPIRDLEDDLGKYGFFRCHASFLVSVDSIQEIRKTDILLKDGNVVPISQRRKKAFMDALSEYLGEQM